MKTWQPMMISLARNAWLKYKIQSSKFLFRTSKRFVGGRITSEAIKTAESLKRMGISASLFYLGEYVKQHGKDWWPYVARRIGESPKNLMFLLKALKQF